MASFGANAVWQSDDDFHSLLFEGDTDTWALDDWSWDPFNLVAVSKLETTCPEPLHKRSRAEPPHSAPLAAAGARSGSTACAPAKSSVYLPATTQCRQSALETIPAAPVIAASDLATPMLFESQLHPNPLRTIESGKNSHLGPATTPQVHSWYPGAAEPVQPALLVHDTFLTQHGPPSKLAPLEGSAPNFGRSGQHMHPASFSQAQATPISQLQSSHSTQILQHTPSLYASPSSTCMPATTTQPQPSSCCAHGTTQSTTAPTAQALPASCCAIKLTPAAGGQAPVAGSAPPAEGTSAPSSCCAKPSGQGTGAAAPAAGGCCGNKNQSKKVAVGEGEKPKGRAPGGCCNSAGRGGGCKCWADPANGCGCTCCYRDNDPLPQPESSVQSYNQQGLLGKRSTSDYALSNAPAQLLASAVSSVNRPAATVPYSIERGTVLKMPQDTYDLGRSPLDAPLAAAMQLAATDPRPSDYWAHNSPDSITQQMSADCDVCSADVPVLLPAGPGDQNELVCLVQGCSRPLSNLKDYHLRYRICAEHIKLPHILRDGRLQRFCQQCGRFHLLSAFDGERRSCRDQLNKHNLRRRMRRAAANGTMDSMNGSGWGGETATNTNWTSYDERQVHSMEEVSRDEYSRGWQAPRAPVAAITPAARQHLSSWMVYQQPPPADIKPVKMETAATATVGPAAGAADDGSRLLQTLLQNPSHLQTLRMMLGVQQPPAQALKREHTAPPVDSHENQLLYGPPSPGGCCCAPCDNTEPSSSWPKLGDGSAPVIKQEPDIVPADLGGSSLDIVPSDVRSSAQELPWELTGRRQAEEPPAAAAYDPDHLSARLSFKIFKKTPADIPADLKRQVGAWLALAPASMEGHIRPGCVQVTVQLLLTPAAYDQLCDRSIVSLAEHLLASRHPCWCTGVVLLQLFDETLLLVAGHVRRPSSVRLLPGLSWQAPLLHSVWPLCAVGQSSDGGAVVKLRGNGLAAGSTCQAVCRTIRSSIVTENIQVEDEQCEALLQLAPLPGCWLAFVELEAQGGVLSQELPLLLVDEPELAQEINRLATCGMDPDSVCCLLVELGTVLQAASQQLPLGLPDSELASKAHRLLVLACQQRWPAVAQRLLPLAMLSSVLPAAAAEAAEALRRAGILPQQPAQGQDEPVRQGCGCGCTCPCSPMRC